jgi:aromatic ring-opening dioxygenase LigB subunit
VTVYTYFLAREAVVVLTPAASYMTSSINTFALSLVLVEKNAKIAVSIPISEVLQSIAVDFQIVDSRGL